MYVVSIYHDNLTGICNHITLYNPAITKVQSQWSWKLYFDFHEPDQWSFI